MGNELSLFASIMTCVHGEEEKQHKMLGDFIKTSQCNNGALIDIMCRATSKKVFDRAFNAIRTPIEEGERNRLLYVCHGKADLVAKINNMPLVGQTTARGLQPVAAVA